MYLQIIYLYNICLDSVVRNIYSMYFWYEDLKVLQKTLTFSDKKLLLNIMLTSSKITVFATVKN